MTRTGPKEAREDTDGPGPAGSSAADVAAGGRAGGLPRVLVVDDEESLRHLLRLILRRAGHPVVEAADGQEALEILDADPELRVVLCDVRMPRMGGLEFLEAVSGRDLRVVVMSAYGSTATAVEALQRGAYDYINKPFQAEEIRVCLERIVERERLEEENRRLRARVERTRGRSGFLGDSEQVRRILEVVERVAAYPSTVLITGESGTGKELLARALHESSPRSGRRLVAVNCAAIPENLLESELFGHERGAFTGAVRAHAGLFEQADGSTLLLDEIGDMPLALQTRLLRVLEDGRVRRVGGSKDVAVDVRVVAATARDLREDVRSGAFREDLFYRLNVVHIRIPPLRERPEDIPLLAETFLRRSAERLGRPLEGLEADALRALVACPWPGNVRQLENALERACLLAAGSRLRREDLPPEVRGEPLEEAGPRGAARATEPGEAEDLSIKRRAAALEAELIAKALERTGGNRSQAAPLLEISYKALLYKIRQYGLEP